MGNELPDEKISNFIYESKRRSLYGTVAHKKSGMIIHKHISARIRERRAEPKDPTGAPIPPAGPDGTGPHTSKVKPASTGTRQSVHGRRRPAAVG